MAPTTTRRQRLRDATEADIKDAALVQIAEVGATALSLRGVARAVGMSPAGLYRYYDGRDELLTALLVDAYGDLADTVEAAIGAGLEEQDEVELLASLRRGVDAYRGWAVAHPNRFLLIFGTPVPGYAAPEGGPTVTANRRMGEAFMTVAAHAHARGLLVDPPDVIATDAEAELGQQLRAISPDLPAAMVRRLLGMWARWHGLVMLEVTHQLDWAYGDPGTLFATEVDAMLDEVCSEQLSARRP